MNQIYVIDTSELINLSRHYPRDIFSSLWIKVENLISEGRIISPNEVRDEIKRGHDELTAWCKVHPQMFHSTDRIIKLVKKIISEHPKIVNPNASHEVADPYIIALAISYKSNMTGLPPIIVTDENISRESRIPYVAGSKGVQTCKLVEMFQKEGWQF